jgi:2-C-methyl-D-erythritol 4-phosphate cytidylyltransferase
MLGNKQLILVAGGLGTRLGHSHPKALVLIAGIPLLVRTLSAFQSENLVDNAIVVYPEGFEAEFSDILTSHFPTTSIKLVPGGQERFDSVSNGLEHLTNDTKLVIIHDAARPFIQKETIHKAISTALKSGASTVATPCKDTILQSNDQLILKSTPDRSSLWACQTPQIFRRDIIEKAYSSNKPKKNTDDATLVNEIGVNVIIVEGSDTNIKITTPHDLDYAECLIAKGKV